MTDKTETATLFTIGSLSSFSDLLLIVIVSLNFIITVFCLLKCVKILSWIQPKKGEKSLSSLADLSSPFVLSEPTSSETTSAETKNSDSLLIDRAIKSIRSGFTQSQISQKFDIEAEYLEILYRAYYTKHS